MCWPPWFCCGSRPGSCKEISAGVETEGCVQLCLTKSLLLRINNPGVGGGSLHWVAMALPTHPAILEVETLQLLL